SILTSGGVQVVSVPHTAEVTTISVPTGSGMVPTASPIFTTASVVARQKVGSLYLSRGNLSSLAVEKSSGSENSSLALAREDQRISEQIARDAQITRIHAEEELQLLIDSLDRNNETISMYLQEYEQFAVDLSIGERIELINDLVKYQDNYAKVLKYQAQQSKPLSKKQQREFYMSVLRSHAGWKTKHFKGMLLEEIKEKFIHVWKQIEDFVPMAKDVSKEDLKEMMQATNDKEKELWVELKRLYEHDVEDQLWIHTQALMHDPKDYPLRKGLAIVMIGNKLQVENYSQMANDLIQKIHKIATSPRQRDD
nr:hypothetical protein [Tanacetum cinerariifolium]